MEAYRADLWKGLLVGNIETLAALVLVRTFLSWTLNLDIEGRWSWQKTPGCGAPRRPSAVRKSLRRQDRSYGECRGIVDCVQRRFNQSAILDSGNRDQRRRCRGATGKIPGPRETGGQWS